MFTELACLATAIYFEARGEPMVGQVAVAQVINKVIITVGTQSYLFVINANLVFGVMENQKL